MEVVFIEDVRDWIDDLKEPVRAKTYKTIELLTLFGHQLGLPQSRALGSGLFELRVRGKLEIRVFYFFHRGQAVLLHAFQKTSQKIPTREINKAQARVTQLTKI